jgi:hypothetical protein
MVMKSRLARMALLALGVAAFGYAQILVAEIPFNFQIGEQIYTAGRYQLSPNVLRGDPSAVWVIRSDETRTTAVFQTHFGAQKFEPPRVGRLVFHRYGRTSFLFEVWIGGRNTSSQLPLSRCERDLARSTRLVAEVVTVKLAG